MSEDIRTVIGVISLFMFLYLLVWEWKDYCSRISRIYADFECCSLFKVIKCKGLNTYYLLYDKAIKNE